MSDEETKNKGYVPDETSSLGRANERTVPLTSPVFGPSGWLESVCDWGLLDETCKSRRYLF